MATPYIMRKGVSRASDLQGGSNLEVLGAGNVYRVIKSDEAYVDQFMADHLFEHTDGSASVHTTIQAALDATVEGRNDYVLVQPSDSDYDITAGLTLSKKAVHLIGLGSLYGNGAGNSVRLHQTGNFPIATLTDAAIEISGFYLKNAATYGGIILGANTYGLNIHHNYFAMSLSGGTNEPMLGQLIAAGNVDYGSWSTLSDNFIQSQAGANATIAAIVGNFGTTVTGLRIERFQIGIGDTNNTATVGILNNATKGSVNDCDFFAYQTSTGAGVFTHCISIHASGVAFGNRGNVADSELITGGTDELSFIFNYNSVGGGTQDEQ